MYLKNAETDPTQYSTDPNASTSVPCPCFTNTCDILTPSGPVNVADVKAGDLLVSGEKGVKILRAVSSYSTDKPHLLAKDSLKPGMPNKDTFISHDHKYMKDGALVCGGEESKYAESSVTYYHIQVEGGAMLMVNGVEMESWDGKL